MRGPFLALLPCSSLCTGGSVGGLLDTPRGSASPQGVCYVDDDAAARLFLGVIGSSGRFCAAFKTRGANHCGMVTHAKSKFEVVSGSYYPPARSLLGKPSAKQSPSILKTDVPRPMRDLFERGSYPMGTWESLFHDAIQKGPPTPLRTQGRREMSSPIAELGGIDSDPEIMSVGSVPSSVSFINLEGDAAVDSTCYPTWETVVDTSQPPSAWALAALEQRATIERMCGILDNLSTALPQVVDKLNSRFRPVLRDHARVLRSLRDESSELREHLSSLLQLTSEHGSVSGAVKVALTRSSTLLAALQNFSALCVMSPLNFASTLTLCYSSHPNTARSAEWSK